jgi:hypothetical protein
MVIDSYPVSNFENIYVIVAEVGINEAMGQSFTGDGSTLESATFHVSLEDGTASGVLTAYIYAHTGTFGTSSTPTGSALATSDSLSYLDIVNGLNTFTFSGVNQITLTNATKYCVVIAYVPDASDDPNNDYVYIGIDDISPTHAGNAFSNVNGGAWTVQSGYDFIFYVNGLDSAGASIAWITA